MFDFEYQIKMLPDKPGVYIMKNTLDEVIYVGKAKILKNRVKQYFQNSKNHTEKVKAMVKNIAEFEYIVTDTEIEALILECNLIKKYRPRYNILMKDDKYYPCIKITINEDFPRILIVRNIINDGSKYFGPYPDVSSVYEIMKVIKDIFPVRQCKKLIKEGGEKIRPCLNYQIGLCKGPCGGFISKGEYNKFISKIIDILSGKDKSIVNELRSEMQICSNRMEFEKAANLRDKVLAIQKITEKQKIINNKFNNEDYINVYSDEKDSCVQIFFFRDGKLLGRENFILQNTNDYSEGEIIEEFIKNFYGGTAFIPIEIYVPAICEQELLQEFLSIKSGKKIEIKIPQIGEKKSILNMVWNNAKTTMDAFKQKITFDKENNKKMLYELSKTLNLEQEIFRIEAYDISNIQGVDSVGSMIVFEEGKPKNSDYRRFKIKTVTGANDYDSIREILIRRFQHGLQEIKSIQNSEINLSSGKFSVFPDLIMMDGGKGQVNVALQVLKEFNISIPVCGMVKDDRHNTRGMIYNNNEIIFDDSSPIMNLITKIQDEAHRFAITYHRTIRDKRILHSILDDIPNIGDKRRKELLKKFGSVDSIKKASFDDLITTPSIDKKAAESILIFFGRKK